VKSEQIFKIFALLESVWNLLQNPYNIIHLTLDMFLYYPGKLKINYSQIFSRYDKCTNFNSSMHVTVHSECIYVLTEYLKY